MTDQKNRQWIAWGITVILIVLGTLIGVRFPIPEPPTDTMQALGVTNLNSLHLAVPTTQATATPGLMIDSAGVSNPFEIRDSGTPVARVANGGALDYQISYAAKTSSYTITAVESGSLFSNAGASAQITFILPAAAAGYHYCIYTSANYSVTIDPASGDQIHHLTDSPGDKIENKTLGDSVCLVAIDSTYWYPVHETGTWTDYD